MTIIVERAPESGNTIVDEALRRRLPANKSLFEAVEVPRIGTAIPLYEIKFQNIREIVPINQAVQIGWRYPLVAGEASLAHLATGENDVRYEGLTTGLLARRLFEAAELANRFLGNAPEVFEARLLQIPALQIFALWLKGERDLFVSLMEGEPAGSAELALSDSIVQSIARAISALPERPLQDRSPTN